MIALRVEVLSLRSPTVDLHADERGDGNRIPCASVDERCERPIVQKVLMHYERSTQPSQPHRFWRAHTEIQYTVSALYVIDRRNIDTFPSHEIWGHIRLALRRIRVVPDVLRRDDPARKWDTEISGQPTRSVHIGFSG